MCDRLLDLAHRADLKDSAKNDIGVIKATASKAFSKTRQSSKTRLMHQCGADLRRTHSMESLQDSVMSSSEDVKKSISTDDAAEESGNESDHFSQSDGLALLKRKGKRGARKGAGVEGGSNGVDTEESIAIAHALAAAEYTDDVRDRADDLKVR